ncbi:hypothetical protein G6F43_008669 [Rhizopus delemar]|nr:hypothetical protein G6F43_008669 [Rhizopus delemar]
MDLTKAFAGYRKAAHQLSTVLLSGTLDKDLDWKDHEYLVLSHVISNLAKKIELVDSVEGAKAIDESGVQLQKLASDLHLTKKALMKRIIGTIGKLLVYALKDEKCIGENELTCSYFDPILSRLLANPANNVHLRWSNTTTAETPRQRPDAVISKMRQLSFGPSLGFGEVKVQSTANHDLCHDILRLALFSKESIDMNKLAGCFSFQIHGFGITFYLMQLQYTGIYTMIEVGHLTFPRSIHELPTFINPSTLATLLHVGDAFWRLCSTTNDPSVIISRSTPTDP